MGALPKPIGPRPYTCASMCDRHATVKGWAIRVTVAEADVPAPTEVLPHVVSFLAAERW